MAKRKRGDINRGNEDDYSLIPRGKAYQPFIMIQDVPSLGRSSRPRGIKTGRQHDFLSDLERNYFMILEFLDDVVDIREQFPLKVTETFLIAAELGIKHPANPATKEPITMISDFCITLSEGKSQRDIIRTTKYKKDLVNRRVIEKFAIEKTYWERHGLDWGIVTEEEVDKNYSQNVSDILDYYELDDNEAFRDISFEERDDIIIAFLQRLIDSLKTVRQISSLFEKDLHLEKGTGIALFKHLVAKKYISIDLFSPLRLDKHLRVELLDRAREIGDIVS
ncbi:MAG TPA: TnsA endonuclease N-terminal domain-containing protein [Desulfosporosinus sp.]|nr:TnsA endonuclease N-terminal domain-containing protein [Desulfosporosinus sp.]